jgi:hypothetical protein
MSISANTERADNTPTTPAPARVSFGAPIAEPDDVRPAWRIAAVLAAAAGLAVTSTWLGLLVAGGWPAALDF